MARKTEQTEQAGRVRLRVRIDPARVPRGMVMPVRRLRAGYTFTRNPVEIEVSPEAAVVIESDPILAVERIDGGGA